MKGLISVIVPIYRVEKYLDKCIQSILNQSYSNLEIILVDDGSDDASGEICDAYEKMDARIKVIHQKNMGLDAARKAGVSVAKGEYIGYVDGDDWIHESMYECLMELARKYDVEVVESGIVDVWDEVHKKRKPFLKEGCYKGDIFEEKIESNLLYGGKFFRHGISPYLCTKLFKASSVSRFQLLEEVLNKTADDVVVSMPTIACSKSLYISHECYYYYRVRTDSGKRKEDKEKVVSFIKSIDVLKKRFEGTKLRRKDDKQIDYFVLYWLLMKAPYVFDDDKGDKILIPFGGIDMNSKVVLYGAGAAGIHMHNYLKSVSINVVAWLDKNYDSLKDTLEVVNPMEIQNLEYDYVVICVLREEMIDSIREILRGLRVADNKILWIKNCYIENPSLLLEKIKY